MFGSCPGRDKIQVEQKKQKEGKSHRDEIKTYDEHIFKPVD
jgi:hypothetical protein